MSVNSIEVVTVVSLTILAVSLFALMIALLPLLSQAGRLLSNLNDTVKTLNERILPNFAEFSEVFSGAKKMIDKGQNLSDKLSKSAGAWTEGLRAGLKAYFSNKTKKLTSDNSGKTVID